MQASVKTALASLIEEHMTSLIREAECVKRHCKRARFHSLGGENAAAAFAAMDDSTMQQQQGIIRRRLHVDDINMALQWRGSEKLYATGVNTITTTTDNHNHNNKRRAHLLSAEQENANKIDLDAYLQSELRVLPPSEMGMTVHWLSVNGIQPEIPQNPSPSLHLLQRQQQQQQQQQQQRGAGGAAAAGASRIVHRVEQDEEEEADNLAGETTAGPITDDEDDGQPAAGPSTDVHVHQLLPRLLSEELQLYFTKITLAVERSHQVGGVGGSAAATAVTDGGTATTTTTASTSVVDLAAEQDAAIASVGRDLGLQELVPFLIRYITKELYRRIGNIEHCRTLVRLAQALLRNPHLHVELHLHQLLPPLITCVVAKRLSAPGKLDNHQHWTLRQEAAQTLVKACTLFGEDYVTLKARVLKTLCEAIGTDRPLETRFGGIVGITSFGPKAVDAFLLPWVIPFWNSWEQQQARRLLQQKPPPPPRDQQQPQQDLHLQMYEQEALDMCQFALLNALRVYFQSFRSMEAPSADYFTYEELVEGTFGDKLVMLSGEETDYVMCFI